MISSLQHLRGDAIEFAEGLVRDSLSRPTERAQWLELLQRLEARGWLGTGLQNLAEAGAILEGLARGGVDAGVPMTLTVHYVMALHVLRTFYPEQAAAVVKSGGLTCMGASEPKVGSHPGKIETRAELIGGTWRISGRKVFTTGGPLASHLLVLAVCSESDDGRDLGVFLVKTMAPGVHIETMPTHPGLESAPHAATEFDNAPAVERLGKAGVRKNGWTQIVRPFRQWEDALLQSWVAGIAWRQAHASTLSACGASALLRGRLITTVEGLSTLAADAAQSVLDEQSGTPRESLVARRYAFFELLRAMEPIVGEIRQSMSGAPPPELATLQGLLNQLRFASRAREKLLAQLAER